METFDELVTTHDYGRTNESATTTLRAMVEAVRAHAERAGAAKGEIALKFNFVAGSDGRVEITSAVTAKTPAPPKAKETRWIDKDGALVASDPRQQKLALKTVGGAAPLKSPDRKSP